MLKHNHHRQDVLKKDGVQKFFEKNEAELKKVVDEEIKESSYIKVTAAESEALLDSLAKYSTSPKRSEETKKVIEFEKVEYFNRKYITFNEAQDSAHKTPLPVLVNGLAGSGKTSVSLLKLKQLFLSLPQTEPAQTITFVTPQAKLKNEVFDIFRDLLITDDIEFTINDAECQIMLGKHNLVFSDIDQLSTRVLTSESQPHYLSKKKYWIIFTNIQKNYQSFKNT